jgi:hypothetical protein
MAIQNIKLFLRLESILGAQTVWEIPLMFEHFEKYFSNNVGN